MQTLRPVNQKIIVKKVDKLRKSTDGSPFSMLPTNDSLGEVIFSDHPDYTVGMKIYYSGKIDRFSLSGTEVHSMSHDNIIAILEDGYEHKEVNG